MLRVRFPAGAPPESRAAGGQSSSFRQPDSAGLIAPQPGDRVRHGRNDLTSLDLFAEGLAVGIFTDEAWVENVSRVTR